MTGQGPDECRHLSGPDPPRLPQFLTLPFPQAAKKLLTHPAARPEHPALSTGSMQEGTGQRGPERQCQRFLFTAAATVLPAAGI